MSVHVVLFLIDLRHLQPRLVCEATHQKPVHAGWDECCIRIQADGFERRNLTSPEPGQGFVHIRFRHRILGWSLVRTRLFEDEGDEVWCILDQDEKLLRSYNYHGGVRAAHAMAFAEAEMLKDQQGRGIDQPLLRWRKHALSGGEQHQELLVQIDDWPRTYESPHYRTRNVLAHVRTSVRRAYTGERILFLEEVQSDWHAALSASIKSGDRDPFFADPPDAPQRKQWPLLVMKLMVWHAHRMGLDGLAWSTEKLQSERWGLQPPALLYGKLLPKAARAIADALKLRIGRVQFCVPYRPQSVEQGRKGWEVRTSSGVPITKPFQNKEQADAFALLSCCKQIYEMPMMWLAGLAPIESVPLYGVGSMASWHDPHYLAAQSSGSADAPIVIHVG